LPLASLAACQRDPAPAAATPGTAAPAPATAGERKFLLETVDEAAVVQLYADGFSALPLREKTLIYHLTQAAIAGRDIYYDQKHRDGLAMRGVLEAIVRHPAGIDAATLAAIQTYTKLFWLNNGPYNNLTAQKFVLTIAPDVFAGGGPQGGSRRRDLPDGARRVARLAALSDCSRCSSTRTSTRTSPARRRTAATSCPPARTISIPACADTI
jgi:hypothetical protein